MIQIVSSCVCCVEIIIWIVIAQPLSVIFTNCFQPKEFSLIKISVVWRQAWIYNHKIKLLYSKEIIATEGALRRRIDAAFCSGFMPCVAALLIQSGPVPWAAPRGRTQGYRVCSQGCSPPPSPSSLPHHLVKLLAPLFSPSRWTQAAWKKMLIKFCSGQKWCSVKHSLFSLESLTFALIFWVFFLPK